MRTQAAENSRPAESTQTASDSGEPMSTQSSTDTGDLDLDAIIAAGGSFDDQSAANASDSEMYQQLDDEEDDGEYPQDMQVQEQEEDEEEEDPDASYPDRPVRSYTLAGLLELADISLPEDFEQEEREVPISGLQNRSHKVQPGDLYIHIAKPDEDIWGCVHEALQRGAAAIIVSEAFEAEEDLEVPVMLLPDCLDAQQRLAIAFYDNPSTKMTVVGVTGSCGKTTTSWLIRGMFDELDKSAGLIGSVEYGIDEYLMNEEGDLWKRDEPDPTLRRESSVPYCLTPYCGKYVVPETLPDGLHVQKIMAGQADRGAAACVLECTTSGLQEGRCDYVDFDVAVFTNIAKDKVDAFGGIQQYLDAQGSLFLKLQDHVRQRAVINSDDPYADDFRRFASKVPVVTYAINDRTADVYAEKVSLGIWESEVIIATPIGHINILTPLIGRNNVYNVLAAVATGLSINVPLQTIVAGIEATEVVPGRTEYIDLQQNFQVLVDSADTPEALSRLLDDVKMSGARKILLVFGCEGLQDVGKRPYMGEVAHYKADTVIITNQNQRSEDPNQIVQDIISGFPEDILEYNAKKPWPGGILQDVQRAEYTLREFVFEGQNRFRRYVCEDRYSAIRWAIATAQKGDVVVIAGKGDKDWTEVSDGEDGYIRGWLDDRVECRNALSKLYKLDSMRYMDRTEIPFMVMGEREPRYWEWGKK
ncbi:hypothetical protein ABBQ32_002384 [Trebouxia sp. C0010 RCD-2024]